MRRKNLLWTCFIVMLLTSAALTVTVTFAAATKMKVEPSLVEDIYPEYPTNNTFTVNITVSNVNDLYGWEFTLSFNPSVLEVASHNETKQIPGTDPPIYYNETVYNIYEGPFLETAGETTFYPEANNPFGDVTVASLLWPFPPEGATGSGVLATIEFKVVGYGVCVLDLHDTELQTVVGQYVDKIPHTAEDGLFDNKLINISPIALFDVVHPGMIMPIVGQPITFDASTSNDPDGWLISYDWDFGDGTTDSGMIVNHVFAKVGAYTVSLTVTDNDNDTDTDSCTINVVEWMEGGEFPDILDAWAEHYEWNEGAKGRELKLFGLVGNPSNETSFEVYVEFTVFSREEGAKLGTITTDSVIIEPLQELELNGIMNLRDTTWRVMRPHWTYWSNARISNNIKYTVFTRCYHKPVGSGNFEKGFAAVDFGFKVLGTKHDIAILEVTTNATNAVQIGALLEIYVTIDNEGGNYDELVDIIVKYKGLTMSGTVGTRTIELKQQETRIEKFTLDTSQLDKGPYLILATLPPLTYEQDILDNSGKCLVTLRWAHDVRVASVTPLKEVVEPGETVVINVEVANEGINSETFTVTAYYDTTEIGTQTVTNLLSGATAILTFEWNTTGVATGEYTIKAEATLAEEMYPSDNVLVDGTIKVTQLPVASFIVSPDPPYSVGDTLTFNATASYDPDGTIVSYKWNFGDGNVTTVTDPIITHAYTSIGNFAVTLTVTDDTGATGTFTDYVTVLGHDIEVTSVTASPSLVKTGESVSIDVIVTNVGNFSETFTVTVYANTTEIGTKTVVSLDTGENTTLEFTWDTTAKGYYVIEANASAVPDEVDVTNNVGSCVVDVRWAHDIRVVSVIPSSDVVELGETVVINVEVANEGTHTESFKVTVYADTTEIGMEAINTLRSDEKVTLTFEWNTTGVATGEYTITAEATLKPEMFPDDNTLSTTIKVTQLPVASFTVSPDPPYSVGDTLTFNATASYDPDGTIVSYFWDFGDDTNAMSVIVDHVYEEAGDFTVTLTVTDDTGATDTATMVVTIEETP